MPCPQVYVKKHSAENIPPECFQNHITASGTQGRSGLVRSALEKLSLFSPTFPVRQKHGAGNFAVCGQRLRGHVPSKNTSPTALSWISLFGDSFLKSFCFYTMRFVTALATLRLQLRSLTTPWFCIIIELSVSESILFRFDKRNRSTICRKEGIA